MSGIITFFQEHWGDCLAIIGAIVSLASVIVKLTPTQKDDKVLKYIIDFLAKFSIINTKEDQEKIDNAK